MRCLIWLCLVFLCVPVTHAKTIRVATFNIQELSWQKLQQCDAEGRGANPQLMAAAKVLQIVRPDVVLINEIDFTGPIDVDGPIATDKNAARAFVDRYLGVPQGKQMPLAFDHIVYLATNTGMPTGIDLNNNGKTDDPNDAFGYGKYPGEYGMALYSRFPIDNAMVRTFRKLLWKDVPECLIPDGNEGRPEFYSQAARSIFRLSSKSHWDIPVTIEGRLIHLLCSHPTPPVFDGPEDSNGRRNHDEIRLWRDYLSGPKQSSWIRDDRGGRGGLDESSDFIVMGDLNADPVRGDLVNNARPIDLLLKHPRVFDPKPESAGAKVGNYRAEFEAVKRFRTSDFGRLDYVLPCRELRVVGTGVFWPGEDDPQSEFASRASDHRLVWGDLDLP